MHAASPQPEIKATRVDRIEHWFRNQPIFSILIFAGIAVIAVSEVAQHGSDLLIRVGLKQEKTLELATENAKGELSRKLVALASKRIFWTRNYYTRVELARPPEEIDYSWNRQLDAVAEWSTDLITNLNTIREYYPTSDKLGQFDHIHEEFRQLESTLVLLRSTEEGLRRKPLSGTASGEEQEKQVKDLIEKAGSMTDQINYDLYMFALNEQEEQLTGHTAAK